MSTSRTQRGSVAVLAGACALALAGTAQAAFWQENFNYADSATLMTAGTGWTAGSGNQAQLGGTGTAVTYTPNIALAPTTPVTTIIGTAPAVNYPTGTGVLGNGVIYRDFKDASNNPISLNGNFTLNLKWLYSSYSRTAKVLLTNAAGTQGYSLQWLSQNANQYDGGGSFSVFEINRASAIGLYNDATGFTALGATMSNAPGGTHIHPVTGLNLTSDEAAKTVTLGTNLVAGNTPVMADVSMQFVNGAFTVSVDGNILGTRTDTTSPFTSFDRMYLIGSTNAIFDDITITVPEPTMLAPLAIGGALTLARRRKTAAL